MSYLDLRDLNSVYDAGLLLWIYKFDNTFVIPGSELDFTNHLDFKLSLKRSRDNNWEKTSKANCPNKLCSQTEHPRCFPNISLESENIILTSTSFSRDPNHSFRPTRVNFDAQELIAP